MASEISNGAVIVTTAGTAVPLSATSVAIKGVLIQMAEDNTGLIYVGNSSVDATNAPAWAAGLVFTMEIDDLSKVYIDASADGDAVTYLTIG